jgi:hypothetical protein
MQPPRRPCPTPHAPLQPPSQPTLRTHTLFCKPYTRIPRALKPYPSLSLETPTLPAVPPLTDGAAPNAPCMSDEDRQTHDDPNATRPHRIHMSPYPSQLLARGAHPLCTCVQPHTCAIPNPLFPC